MRLLEGQPVNVLLVDLGLPDGSGIDIIRSATEKWPSCDIMVCTTFGDENHVIRSLEAGAAGYLLKDSEPHSMLDEIRSINAGGSPISPLIARRILMQFHPERGAAVSPRYPRLSIRKTACRHAKCKRWNSSPRDLPPTRSLA